MANTFNEKELLPDQASLTLCHVEKVDDHNWMVNTNRRLRFEVRQLFYGRKPHVYRILFRITGDTVYILRIRHGRRRPSLH